MWYYENWTKNTRFGINYEEHLHHEKTSFQEIDFYKSKEWGIFFTLDGLMMLTEKDEFIYHEMIVHPALNTNPNIKTVLVIGGGDGGTVRELLRYSSIKKIDLVEIDKRVIELSKKYIPNIVDSIKDSRVTTHITDGVKFVSDAPKNIYDLIIIDSTDPIGEGAGLFTATFYNNCYSILTDEGILINQNESPYFKKYQKEMIRAHDKLKNIFPICKIYQFHQAVYPSGHWLFGFSSKKLDPLKNHQINKANLKTKYYNDKIHIGSFMLPTYVNELLNN